MGVSGAAGTRVKSLLCHSTSIPPSSVPVSDITDEDEPPPQQQTAEHHPPHQQAKGSTKQDKAIIFGMLDEDFANLVEDRGVFMAQGVLGAAAA